MIDKLELLIALANAKHFGKAAEAAGVSQPTLSSSLKSLEESLGVVIVERGSRFRGFTAEGETVLEWARRLVGDARTMREQVSALKQGLGGQLRIGVVPSALQFVTELSLPFQERHKDVRLTVTSTTSIALLSAMENFEVDLGISYVENEPVGRFQTIGLYSERYAVLASSSHPVAQRSSITWKEASELNLCLLTPDMQNRRIIDEQLRKVGSAGSPTLETNSMMLVFTHVRTGRWVAIIPLRFIDPFDRVDALRVIPLVEPEVEKRIGLIVPGREPFTPLVTAFVNVAKRFLAEQRKPMPSSTI